MLTTYPMTDLEVLRTHEPVVMAAIPPSTLIQMHAAASSDRRISCRRRDLFGEDYEKFFEMVLL
jgi:hypothetical protein